MTAQVAPSMVEKEMITVIVDTLLVFYYEKMVGYMSSSFTDLVFVGERIEFHIILLYISLFFHFPSYLSNRFLVSN